MVGWPGTDFLVFRDTHSEFGGQADEIGVSRPGFAIAYIDQAQTQRPPNGGVGAVDHPRSHCRGRKVDPRLLGDGPVDQNQRRLGMSRYLHVPVVHLGLGQGVDGGEEDAELLGLAAGHDGVNGNLLHRRQAKAGLHHHEYFTGLTPGSLQHLLYSRRGGRDDGDAVAPVPLRKKAIHRVQTQRRLIHLHREGLGCLTTVLRAFGSWSGGKLGEAADYAIDLLVNHLADKVRLLASGSMGDGHKGSAGLPPTIDARLPGPGKAPSRNGHGRYARLLNGDHVVGKPRRAAPSMRGSADNGVHLLGNPGGLFIIYVIPPA